MSLRSHAIFVLTATLLVHGAAAQTLTDKLVAEDPNKLVQQARLDGDIVRGAILFHQGNINCAKCHRSAAERDRIGPDLSRMDREVTDEFIVESILQPSKTIKQGFETFVAVDVDGRLVSGIIVAENVQNLVIRDIQDVDQLITIRREDLDEIRPGNKSSMPENLADELKNRQQFLDLLRYVIDIKERGPDTDTAASQTAVRRELSPELNGLVLIQQMNCVACHKSDSIQALVTAKKAPQLKWSAKWLNPEFLKEFIANPHTVKPGTTMPDMLGHLDEATRTNTAEAITHFLVSNANNAFQTQPIDVDSVRRGYELFHAVGCVACHSPRNEDASEQTMDDSFPLGNLVPKYNVSGLVTFLEDPLVVRPSGHMPNMQLTHREATDISNFLLQSTTGFTNKWKSDLQLARQGESLFSKYNCASCHTDQTGDIPKTASQLPLENLNPAQGCLSGKNGNWPKFDLRESEVESIRAALARHPMELTDEQQIEVTLTSFNCIACHDRGDLGGVIAHRNVHFQTTNMNLGDQGRIPPTLTGVGAKLKPKWMRDVLVNGRTIRPYMKTRMPQYGEENVKHLVELFQTSDRLAETKFAEFKDQKEMRKKGLQLAGNKGLNCVACHTYKYKLSDTMPAVDLTEMTERLKKEWFYQYMLAPQKLSPNTVMPSFWPGGQAIRKDIEGRPEDQIEALWQYLIDGRLAGTPSGVVRQPLEIAVTTEAKMLRRSYPGIGKRGIGVGYPGGVNLAYDAEQMRLGAVWRGKFVDPAGVWTGQGSGNVRAMGKMFSFANGPDLDNKHSSWIVDDGRPPKHQFLGYFLDKSRRPTFRYRFDPIEVEEFFSEVIDDATEKIHLRRSVLMWTNQPRDNLRFRIASAPVITVEGDGTFSVGDQLKIRLASDHVARVVDADDGKRLEIPLGLAADNKQKLVIEYLWR